MADHPINDLMSTSLENIKKMVDVNTIVGDPIILENGMCIVPVSKVSFGYGAGGSEFAPKTAAATSPFGGASGAGVSITPVAFLIVNGESVKLIQISTETTSADRVISLVPDLVDKVSEMFRKDGKESKKSDSTPPNQETDNVE